MLEAQVLLLFVMGPERGRLPSAAEESCNPRWFSLQPGQPSSPNISCCGRGKPGQAYHTHEKTLALSQDGSKPRIPGLRGVLGWTPSEADPEPRNRVKVAGLGGDAGKCWAEGVGYRDRRCPSQRWNQPTALKPLSLMLFPQHEKPRFGDWAPCVEKEN